MITFEISTIVDKPADIVSKALNNPENHPYWTTDLDRFEVIKGRANEVGSIARLHYSQKGRPYVMEDKLIYCEPGKKYISQVTGDALTAEVETTLRPLGKKTEMGLKWSGKGKTLLLKLLLPLFRSKIIKQARIDLETFKKLVEEKGPDFHSMPVKK